LSLFMITFSSLSTLCITFSRRSSIITQTDNT
jgi:hypothetical protein